MQKLKLISNVRPFDLERENYVTTTLPNSRRSDFRISSLLAVKKYQALAARVSLNRTEASDQLQLPRSAVDHFHCPSLGTIKLIRSSEYLVDNAL